MARSGSVIVATPGVSVVGPNEPGSLFLLAAHPDNVDVTWVGDDGGGAVTRFTGFPLYPSGESAPIEIGNLNLIAFGADHGGDRITWEKLR